MPYASGTLALDHLGAATRSGTGSGWGLEVPNAHEGFGAKGHVLLIRVTRGPECPLHCFYVLDRISPQTLSPPREPFPHLGITSTANAQFFARREFAWRLDSWRACVVVKPAPCRPRDRCQPADCICTPRLRPSAASNPLLRPAVHRPRNGQKMGQNDLGTIQAAVSRRQRTQQGLLLHRTHRAAGKRDGMAHTKGTRARSAHTSHAE